MTTEIKPCPFCWSKAGLIGRKNGGGFVELGVMCYNPECKAGFLGDISPNEARVRWNRRTPDHIPDARKMIDPLISIVTWTRYDGSPETLPEEGFDVIVKGGFGDSFYASRQSMEWRHPAYEIGGVADGFRCSSIHVGDMWAYLPEPPEAEE